MKKFLPRLLYTLSISALSISLFAGAQYAKRKLTLPNQNWAVKVETREEKPFVITIPSYRNSAYCERNLASVFAQKYENYRVIYVDDASPDDTYEKVKNFVTYQNQWGRFTLLKNEVNSGSMFNHIQMSQYYRPDEIVVMLDGDDFLASDTVLQELNSYYANPDVWVTYGQHISFPDYNISRAKSKSFSTLKTADIREIPWFTSALRTCYGGLFHQVKLEDCLFEGAFLPMASDIAYIYPILEMAREHVFCTKGIWYIYNLGTGINDYRKSRPAQIFFEYWLRGLEPYKKLLDHPSKLKKSPSKEMSVVIFSIDQPEELESTLFTLDPKNETFVLYSAETAAMEERYQELKERFSWAEFKKEKGCEPSSEAILFLSSGMTLTPKIKIDEALEDLQKLGVSAYYLLLDSRSYPDRKKVLPLPMVRKGLSGIALSSLERREIEGGTNPFSVIYSKEFVVDWLKRLDGPILREWRSHLPFHQMEKSILGLSSEFTSE